MKFSILWCLVPVQGANWAQLAGDRAQNTATPYIPDQWHRNAETSVRPMWSARWGHAVVVLNQATPRSYLTDEQNSERAKDSDPIIVLLGGDDGLPRDSKNVTPTSELGIGNGKLRNDVWHGKLSSNTQASWKVDDRYFVDGGLFTPNLIRSQMSWKEINPGRIPPTTWPTDTSRATPLTNEDWIACQDVIKHKLFDPSICNDPPIFCYDNILIPGCNEQAVWKRENMWSPRRGFGAAVVNNKIFVIGGRAREYARIDDSRLVGGIAGRGRVETARDHSTIREDVVLKNDIWSSDDEGRTWKLVNPGCEDHQQDVLLGTEVWSRDAADPSMRTNVGSIGSRCFLSSDCAGIAECKSLANTNEKVCVCPMFSPREHHTLSVQRRYSIQNDGSIYEEDVMYVVGGFSSIKQAFCADRACGPADGYRVAMDDVWMSTDGVDWVQIKPAFDKQSSFVGRGSHSALILPMSYGNETVDTRDRLLIFGGETASPQDYSTTYLNDVWELPLPIEPCCRPNTPCANDYECLPNKSDLNAVVANAEWEERSGHTTVYVPPSSSNSFQPMIYLAGGSNTERVFADVWSLDIGVTDVTWQCDFAYNTHGSSNHSTLSSYLNIDSPLATLQRFELPRLDLNGNIQNISTHSASSLATEADLDILSLENITTIEDLASAGLYKILKLRGFDYPGKVAPAVADLCLLREVAIEFEQKCMLRELPSSYFHARATNIQRKPRNVKTSAICGRGGESKPCTEIDWDGCSPMLTSIVDVHGLGDVKVPQIRHNVSKIVEELFCRQVPSGRSLGAAAFVGNKVVILGGLNSDTKHLYRDVWSRDDESPHAVIKTKPASLTPQFQFSFDSNEDGAHVFEYKIFLEDKDITNWTTTTESIGADVSWLDDKKGGPGKGWYTMYVRAIDPSGNRDRGFSTLTNVYRWFYVPPIPWGAVAGGIISALVMIVVGYFVYRRRRKRAALRKFALRRLKRKFKLENKMGRPTNRPLSTERRSANAELLRDLDIHDPIELDERRQTLRRRHSGRPRSGRSGRSHSTSRKSRSSSKGGLDSKAKSREKKRTKETAADEERRRRRRRDREKNRRQNLRDHN